MALNSSTYGSTARSTSKDVLDFYLQLIFVGGLFGVVISFLLGWFPKLGDYAAGGMLVAAIVAVVYLTVPKEIGKAWIQILKGKVGTRPKQLETQLTGDLNLFLLKLEAQQAKHAVDLEMLRCQTEEIHHSAVPELRSFVGFKKEIIQRLNDIATTLATVRAIAEPVRSEGKHFNELLREIESRLERQSTEFDDLRRRTDSFYESISSSLRVSENLNAEVERKLADISNSIVEMRGQETLRHKEAPKLHNLGLYWQGESLQQQVRFKKEESWSPLQADRPLWLFLSYHTPSPATHPLHGHNLLQIFRHSHEQELFHPVGIPSKILEWNIPGFRSTDTPSFMQIEFDAAQFAERILKKTFGADFTEHVLKHLNDNPRIASLWINLAVQLQIHGDIERALATFKEGLLRAMPQDPIR